MKTLSVQTFFFTYVLFINSILFAQSRCSDSLILLLREHQSATIEKQADIFGYLERKHPTIFVTPEAKKLHNDLANDVLHILVEIPPEYRTDRMIAPFLNKWRLSREQLQDLLTYYGAVYFNEPRLAGEPREVISRLQVINRKQDFLKNPQFKERYLYYLRNLTKKSVPEMAIELEISEQDVRAELLQHHLSIEQRFEKPIYGITPNGLEHARELFNQGIAAEEIARRLNFGPQALKFILHYENERNRGVKWDRTMELSGVSFTEEDILTRLYTRGRISLIDLAYYLNREFNTLPGDAHYRTEGAIYAKLDQLNLIDKNQTGPKEVSIENYGLVKSQGKLQKEAALNWIKDHSDLAISEMAETLGVSETGLRGFLNRHYVILPRQLKANLKTLERESIVPSQMMSPATSPIQNAEEGQSILRHHEICRADFKLLQDLEAFINTNNRMPKEIKKKDKTTEEVIESSIYNRIKNMTKRRRIYEFLATSRSYLPPAHYDLIAGYNHQRLEKLKNMEPLVIFNKFKVHIDQFSVLVSRGKHGADQVLAKQINRLKGKHLEEFLSEINKTGNEKYKKAYDEFMSRKNGPIDSGLQVFNKFTIHIDQFGVLVKEGKHGADISLTVQIKKLKGKRHQDFLTEINKPENEKYKKAYDEFMSRKPGTRVKTQPPAHPEP